MVDEAGSSSLDAVADQTIPRGTGAHDPDERPAVDRSVWLDHVRVSRRDDRQAMDRLVREYERYARSLAARLRRGHEPIEDLEQIALEGLLVALRRFDPGRGIPFVAFATPTIMGALRRHYRDHGWLVRVPRSVHELATVLRDRGARLTVELGRSPTPDELAVEVGVSVDELLEVQDALHARSVQSLDAIVGESLALSDAVGGDDPGYRTVEERMVAAEAIETLDEDARRLLELYFVRGWTQSRIAEEIGVSQMQVSRLLSSIIRRLRAMAAAEGDEDR